MEKGKKFDAGKPEYGLIPPVALLEIAKILTFGAQKYSANNWQKVKPKIRYFNAAMRHAWSWMMGERYDPESGMHHLAHAAISLMFLMEHDIIYSANEDNYGNPLTDNLNFSGKVNFYVTPETPKEENT